MAKKTKDVYLKEIVFKYKTRKIKGVPKAIGKSVTNSKAVMALFGDLQNEAKEKMITINLDAKSRIRCFELVALGSLSEVYIKPVEVVRTSIMVSAYAFIVVHNHPSGDPTPSKNDIAFTANLKDVTTKMGLPFYDHIIIGSDGYFSFLDEGMM